MPERPNDERHDDGRNDDDPDTDEDLGQLDPSEVSPHAEDRNVDGITPLPEELTGRASATDEDLVALFENRTDQHMTDGFRGGSDDEPAADDDEIDGDSA